MRIPYNILLILTELYKVVPFKVPSRIDILHQFATDLFKNINVDNMLKVEIHLTDDDQLTNDFILSKANIALIERQIPKLAYKVSYRDGSELFSKVLLPNQYICCGRTIKIKSEFASVTLYDLESVCEARSYHGKCQVCKNAYYHGFTVKDDGSREFITENTEVLSFNSGIVFSWRLMAYINSMVCVGTMSFDKVCSSYRSVVHDDKINPDRIETAWFVFNILKIKTNFSEWPRKNKSKELDIELLCRSVYMEIKSFVNQKWLEHKCDEPGCRQGVIVIDGNEKLYRYICAAEKIRVLGNLGEVNNYKLCINNPDRGNQSKKASKFCMSHNAMKEAKTEEQIDLRPVTRAFSMSLVKTVTTENGCKKLDAIQQYPISKLDKKLFARTAGMFYVFRPCGVRLSHSEMYTSESLSDVFIQLVDIFGKDPHQLNAIVYDRACDLHPFLERIGKEGNLVAARFAELDFIVDTFHAKGHTTSKCDINNPDCRYHPKLDKFEKYKGLNYEIAEQSFNLLNGFKYATRKMSYCKRLLFFKFIDENANSLKFSSSINFE